MKKVTIGDLEFKSIKDALNHYKNLLNNFPEILSIDQYNSLLDLVKRHYNAEEKLKNGVKNFIVKKTYIGTISFHIIDENDNEIDFSYINAIKGPKSMYQKFVLSCRESCRSQIYQYKIKQIKDDKVICSITGKPYSIDEVHVDHIPPYTFKELVDDYIKKNKINVETVEYNSKNISLTFVDKELKSNFNAYHKKYARLRIVNIKYNLSNGYKSKNSSLQGELF